MNNLQVNTNQTPIEIALGIDENGMTTAKRLYEFLELSPAAYARWFKGNVLENEFAENGEDFFPFNTNVECGGQASKDAKLTSNFARKLSMTQKNEKGEQARNYFIQVEDRLKSVSTTYNNLPPELQIVKQLLDSQAMQYMELQKTNKKLDGIKEVVALDTTSWRDDTGSILRKIALELGGGKAFSEVRTESYELLNKRMGVDLKARLTNKRRRMADEGACKSKRDKLSYIDVIADDKKLIEGYTAIVKEMAIKYIN